MAKENGERRDACVGGREARAKNVLAALLLLPPVEGRSFRALFNRSAEHTLHAGDVPR